MCLLNIRFALFVARNARETIRRANILTLFKTVFKKIITDATTPQFSKSGWGNSTLSISSRLKYFLMVSH